MRPTALLFLCLAFPLQANGLDDLRAALSRMQGQGPLRGTYEVNAWSRGGKGKDIEESAGGASAWVEEDASGLQIRWDRGLLRRAEEETHSTKGSDKQGSPGMGIEAASPLKVHAALDFAPRLARLIANGQLKQERPDTHQGRPARVLEVLLPPPRSGAKEADAKENSYVVQIWVGADGLPFAATLTNVVKASKLFISLELTMTEELSFSSLGHRLVVLRREERMASKAMGIEAHTRTVSTFQPK